jgi:hypothetical protein
MNMLSDTNSIVVPCGYEALVDPLTISSKNGMKIYGGGSLKLKAGSNAPLFTFTNVYRSHIWDIEINGNRANQTGQVSHGIDAVNFLFSSVKNCKIRDCDGTGLVIRQTGVMTDESQVTGNYIDFCTAFGIAVLATGDHIIKGNHVKFNDSGNIWIYQSYNVTVEGNMCLSAGLDGAFAITGAGRGILVQGDGTYGRSVIVSGNQCRANTQEGICVYQNPSAIVSNNYCQYNSMESVGGYSGIKIYASDRCLVTGNHSSDFLYAAQAAPFDIRHQNYGLEVDGSSLNAMITCNDFTAADNVTGATNIVAGSTYRSSCNIGLADA